MRRTKSQPALRPTQKKVFEKGVDEDGLEYCVPYQIGKSLGRGGFASCYSIRVLRESQRFAVKAFNKNDTRSKNIEKINNQIQITSSLIHNHIVRFYRRFQNEDYIYMIMELCQKGSLSEVIRARNYLTQPEARYILSQLVQALLYLKNKHVIHRDIKLGNIFLDQNYRVKLGDFGLSMFYDNNLLRRNLCGTPLYMAPELINQNKYGYQIDVWSTGILIYYLLLGRPPFEGDNASEIYEEILEKQLQIKSQDEGNILSTHARSFLRQILHKSPYKRLKLENIMKHPWMTYCQIPQLVEPSFGNSEPSQKYLEEYSSPHFVRKICSDGYSSTTITTKCDKKVKNSSIRQGKQKYLKIEINLSQMSLSEMSNQSGLASKRQHDQNSVQQYFKDVTKKYRYEESVLKRQTRNSAQKKKGNDIVRTVCQRICQNKNGLSQETMSWVFRGGKTQNEREIDSVSRVIHFQLLQNGGLLYLTNHYLLGFIFTDRTSIVFNLNFGNVFYLTKSHGQYSAVDIKDQLPPFICGLMILRDKITTLMTHFDRIKKMTKNNTSIKNDLCNSTNRYFSLTFLTHYQFNQHLHCFKMSSGDLNCWFQDKASLVFAPCSEQIWSFGSNGLEKRTKMQCPESLSQKQRALIIQNNSRLISLIKTGRSSNIGSSISSVRSFVNESRRSSRNKSQNRQNRLTIVINDNRH